MGRQGMSKPHSIRYIRQMMEWGFDKEFIAKVRLLKKVNSEATTINILLNSGGGDVVETLGCGSSPYRETSLFFGV